MIRVRTIRIAPPQSRQASAGRGRIAAAARPGLIRNRRCSSWIRRLLLGWRKPKLRARRSPLGRTWRSSRCRKSAPGSVRVCLRRVRLFWKRKVTWPLWQARMFCSRITPEIAAEVDQGLLAGADMLAIDHPLFGMRRGQGEPGLGESLEHPGPDSPLQRSADLGGELRVAAHQFLEDRHRAQSRRVLEHRYHFLIEDPGQWVRAPPAPKGLSLGGQSRVRLEAVRRRRAEAGLGGRSGGGVGSSNFHVKPHLVIGYVSPRHRVFLLWSEETP